MQSGRLSSVHREVEGPWKMRHGIGLMGTELSHFQGTVEQPACHSFVVHTGPSDCGLVGP